MKLRVAAIFLSTIITFGASTRLIAEAEREEALCFANPTYGCITVPGAGCPSVETATTLCNSSGRCGRTLAGVGCWALGGLSCDGRW